MNEWCVFNTMPINLKDGLTGVYVIEYEDYVKIGRTRQLKERLRTHEIDASKNGKKIKRIAIMPTREYYAAERQLLSKFSFAQVGRTEFFQVNFDDVINYNNHRDTSKQTVDPNESPEVTALKAENKRLAEELKTAQRIAAALGFDWDKFYEEEQA